MRGDEPVKVRIKERISGLLNGAAWPAPGETIDLPKAVAEGMLETGTVVSLSEKVGKVETRPASTEGVETREAPAKRRAAKKV